MKTKYALELFSGSRSVSSVLEAAGYTVISVDWNPHYNPTLCCDILDFPFSLMKFPFSVIWASPDCRKFSREANPEEWTKLVRKYRQYEYVPISREANNALQYLRKTIEIIEHYKPKVYFIENPIGKMRHLPEIKNFVPYRYSVNYKDYGFDYSKETDIYTNQLFALSQKKVIRDGKSVKELNSPSDRAKVPAQLVEFLLTHSQL
jgi:site-specific DNA-cytosine methylase